jgi:hypothetical protein
LEDVVEPVDGSDRDGGGAVGDCLQELLEHRRWKVAGLAGVGGEPPRWAASPSDRTRRSSSCLTACR